MAPAISHFLVGAALLLVLAVPFTLRYGFDREHALWLVPIGGVYGLLPDFHHIAPVFSTELYALHNTPWMDLFAFHYTLDRSAVRARYYQSVFGSIALSFVSVTLFWGSTYVREMNITARGRRNRLNVSLMTVGATAYATAALGIVVSITKGFPSVAALIGADSVLAGGLLLIPIGWGLGVVYAIGLETLAIFEYITDPLQTACIGCTFGAVSWIGGVVLALPFWLRLLTDVTPSIPLVHWGSLVMLIVYGTIFGGIYGLLKGAFSPVASP